MPDPERTRIEFIGGDPITVDAPPNVVEDNLIRAKADGKFCRLIESNGEVELLVNPETVRMLRPAAEPFVGVARGR